MVYKSRQGATNGGSGSAVKAKPEGTDTTCIRLKVTNWVAVLGGGGLKHVGGVSPTL